MSYLSKQKVESILSSLENSEETYVVFKENEEIYVEENKVFIGYISPGSINLIKKLKPYFKDKRPISKIAFELKAGPIIFSKLLSARDSNSIVEYWFRIFDNPDFKYVELGSTNFDNVTKQLVIEGVLTQAEVDQLLA